MTSLPIDKWIHGTLPGDPAAIAAKRSLHAWLGAVQHYLPLAATDYKDSPEYILKLRVWTRRGNVALKLYADLLPSKQAKYLRKDLRAIRKAVSKARDCDVISQRISGADPKTQKLRRKVEKQRKRAQKPLLTLYRDLSRGDRFNRRIARLLEQVSLHSEGDSLKKVKRFDDWARQKLKPQVTNYLDLIKLDRMDVEELHELRLRTKDLRYSMELLGGAFAPDFTCKLYPLIESMQDRLGEINDQAVEQSYMRRRLAKTKNMTDARHLRAQLAGKQSHLNYLIHEFHHWCGPHLLNTLRREFDMYLEEPYHLQLINA